jgi:hypothetical protein
MAFRIARDCPLTPSSASRPPVHMIELNATYPENSKADFEQRFGVGIFLERIRSYDDCTGATSIAI